MISKIVACIALAPLMAAIAGVQDTSAFESKILMAQFKGTVPHGPSIGPSIGPIGPSIGPIGPSITTPIPDYKPLPPPTTFNPAPVTTYPPVGGSPPPPIAQPRRLVPPACVVASTDSWAASGCSARYIGYTDLKNRLRACGDHDARCFASRILELARQPIVVVYPQPAAALSNFIEKELSYAVAIMGNHLRDRVYNGVSNLPSISAINSMVDRAKQAANAINLPLDETPEQQLRRLGLTPDMVNLATSVLNS